jgi:NADPH:quinone reductase-like Zn-dependent oxidoreductase
MAWLSPLKKGWLPLALPLARFTAADTLRDIPHRSTYALLSGQFPALAPRDLIYRGLTLHGFWLGNWIRNAPRTEIQEIYQKLGDLVADGSLSAAVEHVYPLEQFKEAFEQSLKSNRSGKILFKFGAH